MNSQSYDKNWQAITNDMDNQLPKSAFEKTAKLFDRAVAERNQEQIVKTSIYLMHLEPQLKEVEYDSRLQKEIIHLESSIAKTTGSAKYLLISVLAEKYNQYAQQNQYRLSQTSTVVDEKSDNIALWSLASLNEKAQNLYLQSCESKESKTVSLSEFNNLITNANSKYVETLYDFLNYRAIQALNNEQNYITEPTYKFTIKNEQFVDLDKFLALKLETKDTSSNKYLTLKLYQKLLKQHLTDESKNILLDLELRRLEFMFNNYQGADKSKLYENLLKQTFAKFQGTEERYYAMLKLAELKQNNSNQFAETKDSSKQFILRDAHTLYGQIVKDCKDNNIVAQAKNALNSIQESRQLQITTEKVIQNQKPILALISYQNIDKIFYKIIEKKNCKDVEENYYQDQARTFNKLLGNKVVHSGSFTLKNIGDFQQHTTEVALPSLGLGNYYIIFSHRSDFSTSNNILTANSICVSDLAYFVNKNENNGIMNIYVVDRNNGAPIKDASVELFREEWRNNQNETILFKTNKTDMDGKISIKATANESFNFSFIILKNQDKLCENQQEYVYIDENNNQENKSEQVQLYLDREIYRPGQTIYFKGIAFESSYKSAPKIQTNKNIDVVFKDVNEQDIAKKSFTTNEYGTFNGNFTAPNGSLLGQMYIQVNASYNKPVRVEEYKRPTFEIVFDTLKSTPKLDEMVNVSGKAITYSGVPLTGARVKYRVVRKMNYPYWRCWWMPIPTNEAEIGNGEVKTNELGKFDISFKAIPDEDADNSQFPIFNYEVLVDVVDITGETHDAVKSIRIGKVDFEISATVKEQYSSIDIFKIPINITNLNGDKIDKNYQVKISKLKSPTILVQPRYWEHPDLPLMTEAEFKGKFPFLSYKNEYKIEAYPIEGLKKEWTLNSIQNRDVSENLSTWSAGSYKMTISSKSADGKEISIDRYFEIVGGNNINKPILILGLKDKYDINEKPQFSLISSQKNQKILYQIERTGIKTEQLWQSDNIGNIAINLTEQDRGGMNLIWTTVWNNRIYSGREMINIPWTNKELDIEYSTFRDKLQPGQQEEWQVKVKGKKGEKVMAELLANMYDQSLDVFAPNTYSFFPFDNFQSQINTYSHSFGSEESILDFSNLSHTNYLEVKPKEYPRLDLPFVQNFYGGGYRIRMAKGVMAEMALSDAPNRMGDEKNPASVKSTIEFVPPKIVDKVEEDKNGTNTWSGIEKKEKPQQPIKVRSNLNETVFFLPNLMTDKDGNVLIKFKMNEALTKWKFMALATTKELQIGYSEKSVVTQKDLMITPNAPRFMRENDQMEFTAKIANLSDKPQTGTAFIELYDAVTNKNVETEFGLKAVSQPFTIPSGQSTAISWSIKVPEGISALTYRVLAKSDKFSDGEENSLPVLTDRMLVTETMPMNIRANQTKSFTFKDMQEKIKSPTLKNVMYRLEYSSNPIWYAIQSLPYLMEYPHECSEQLFNRYFANALSSSIITQFPRIKSVFESWKGTEAMQSNLSKNQELKSALLEETPWVFEACKEEEQRRNIALLFDINKIAVEEKTIVDKLAERQMSSGGFPWFPGSRESEYITQNIVEGFGHLNALNVEIKNEKATQIIEKAIPYLDQNIVNRYNEMERNIKRYGGNINDDHLDAFAIHYLYTRSYFKNEIPKSTQKVIRYYQDQAIKYWTKKSMYEEGMLALYFHRIKGEISASAEMTKSMMKSFRERALKNEEKGMYWDNPSGYWWYQLPIETHSLMIEVFDNLSNDQTEKDDLRIYLLKNKQTNSWKTTKATAAAIFALLGNQPKSKLEISSAPKIKLGGQDLNIKLSEAEQGTGYFKKTWAKEEVKENLAQIEITNPNQNIAWGSVYWQYNEKMNNIAINKSSPLRVEKKLYKVLNTEKGEQLEEILADNLNIGDRVRVKLMLYIEREMEFLHLKDMRASGFEPRDQVSGYKWSGGLGYYQTSRDASMNFFMDYITKGTYTIEYDLNTNIKGTFSNGITTFQSMYAPEFNSHSEGREVKIK